jgi:8-oxo-dGTP pyrophosphatase MutT (NUDIX family)
MRIQYAKENRVQKYKDKEKKRGPKREEGKKMIRPWKKNSEKEVYDCRVFKVSQRESSSPVTGKTHLFHVLSVPDWVNIIAMTDDKKILTVTQFRHGSGEVTLEIPGGAVDAKDGTPLRAAQRELLEETGHESSEWLLLGKVRPNPAILDNTCYIFLAQKVRKAADLKLDEAEELEVGSHDPGEIKELVRQGKLQHALVLDALYFLELYQKQNPGKV